MITSTTDLKFLRYFVCLAQELHFGRAAEKLHITQPVLSIQIKNLEQQLGGALFIRSRRTVVLTDAGTALLPRAQALLNSQRDLLTYAGDLFHGTAGSIRISYSGLAAFTGVMGRILQRYRQRYPHIVITLIEHTPRQQLDDLSNGNVHISFMTTLGVALPQTMQALFLKAYPLRLLFPPQHPKALRQREDYRELKNEPFVIYAAPDDPGTGVIEKLLGFSPRIIHQASNPLLLPSLVSAGLGLALIPAAFDNIAAQSNVIVRSITAENVEMDISLLCKRGPHSAAVTNFIALAEQEYQR